MVCECCILRVVLPDWIVRNITHVISSSCLNPFGSGQYSHLLAWCCAVPSPNPVVFGYPSDSVSSRKIRAFCPSHASLLPFSCYFLCLQGISCLSPFACAGVCPECLCPPPCLFLAELSLRVMHRWSSFRNSPEFISWDFACNHSF